MIAGINRAWVIDSRLVAVNGYRIGNNRIGLSVASPGFEELIMARGAASYESQKSGNAWEHKVTIIGYSDLAVDMATAFKRQGKRYLLAMYLNSDDMIIVGVDNPLRVSVKNTSGGIPGDISGYTLTFAGLSRNSFEFIDKTIFIPPKIKYGRLYNWFAVADTRGIAPEGWRVATKDDWNLLFSDVGGTNIAGGKLKLSNLLFWNDPNEGATNEFGFNAKGAGFREYVGGSFTQLKEYSMYWSATDYSSTRAWYIFLYTGTAEAYSNINYYKINGHAVRLVKTDPTGWLAEDTVTDIDGNVYPCVKIGDQVWMAENLIVTKYKNGDLIPEVTDNTAWAALTTGAMCAYDNDHANI